MIRFSYSSLEDDSTGRLVVQKQSPDFAEVFYGDYIANLTPAG